MNEEIFERCDALRNKNNEISAIINRYQNLAMDYPLFRQSILKILDKDFINDETISSHLHKEEKERNFMEDSSCSNEKKLLEEISDSGFLKNKDMQKHPEKDLFRGENQDYLSPITSQREHEPVPARHPFHEGKQGGDTGETLGRRIEDLGSEILALTKENENFRNMNEKLKAEVEKLKRANEKQREEARETLKKLDQKKLKLRELKSNTKKLQEQDSGTKRDLELKMKSLMASHAKELEKMRLTNEAKLQGKREKKKSRNKTFEATIQEAVLQRQKLEKEMESFQSFAEGQMKKKDEQIEMLLKAKKEQLELEASKDQEKLELVAKVERLEEEVEQAHARNDRLEAALNESYKIRPVPLEQKMERILDSAFKRAALLKGEFNDFTIENEKVKASDESRIEYTQEEVEDQNLCIFFPPEKNLVFYNGLNAERQGENELRLASLKKSTQSLIYLDSFVEISARWSLVKEKNERSSQKNVLLVRLFIKNLTRGVLKNLDIMMKGTSSSNFPAN